MTLPTVRELVGTLDSLAPMLLNAAIGSVALLGLAGLAALAMRRASAAARHAAWLLGFVALLLLPVLSATLPGWHVLPLHRGAGTKAPDVVVSISAPAPSLMTPARELANDKQPVTSSERPLSAIATATAQRPPLAAAQQAASPAAPAVQRSATQAAPSRAVPWTVWLLTCWAAGALLMLGRVLLGHLSLWSLRRRCARVTQGELFDLLERLRAQLRLRRPVELLTTPARAMPMTWGLLWRARLLVPDQAATWPTSQRRDVLLHELGHVRRFDCLTQLLSQLACALYWFNPLAWVAARRMQVERERACDDLVLNSGAQASDYARHLLASVTPASPFRLAGAAIAMARPSTLEERMRAILDARLNRRGLTARGTLAMMLLLLCALVPSAVLRAQQAPPLDPPPANPGRPATGAPGEPPLGTTRPATTRPAGLPPRFGGRGFGPGPGGAPTVGEGPTCTFDATVYDVRIPVDKIGKLDVEALAKSAESAEAFEKTLASLGTTKPMYRASQSVRLAGDTITIGSQVPVVTNTRVTDKGQAINTVQYSSVGAVFSLAGKATDLDLGIQVSSASDAGAAVSDKVTAPVMRRVTLSHKGPFQPRKPLVLVSVDGDSPDKEGKAVAYIGRIILGEPQPPAAK
jgi:beta-lactamase regulating signal transducer with metallopeptidase domain